MLRKVLNEVEVEAAEGLIDANRPYRTSGTKCKKKETW